MRLGAIELPSLPRNALLDADCDAALESAREVLDTESASLKAVRDSVGSEFVQAIQLIAAVKGRVIVTGMGKSGHVARKIAATFASTGTPSLFVHPGEASHGDLGMLTQEDAVIAISNSGENAELRDITLFTRRFGIPLLAITGRAQSTLAKEADVALVLPQIKEACPLGLAPTSSTTCMMAMGDALAVALLRLAGFSAHDFAVFHPGGKLGSQLLRVEQVMRKDDDLPIVGPTDQVSDALLVMTRKCLGCVVVADDDRRILGVVTDGDLRRHMSVDLLQFRVDRVMTQSPISTRADTLAVEALAVMNAKSVTVLLVVDEDKLVGVLHLHDCLRAGIA